ncbi:MAG: hypothetical protein ABSG67_19755 [Thermoguttaceae bacterium]|jgi:hypothetical protein
MSQGPDFTPKTKEILAKRAGQICSNPDHKRFTSGPHTDYYKAVNLGEAAHIKAARKGQARYDPNMTDEERRDISNGIWLCRECARKIDLDDKKYSIELLHRWKKEHEDYIASGKLIDIDVATREITSRDGSIGSIIQNTGSGIGLDLLHDREGTAERITVEGSGVGEITTNTGPGIGKRIVATGGNTASQSKVIVDKPVNMAFALGTFLVSTSCSHCGHNFTAQKVIQGFAGNSIPKVEVNCPKCRRPVLI